MTIAELKESIEKMKTNEPDYIGKAYNNGLDFCLEMIDVYDKFREDEQALSQEPLKNIREEIASHIGGCGFLNDGLDVALEIIDKHIEGR